MKLPKLPTTLNINGVNYIVNTQSVREYLEYCIPYETEGDFSFMEGFEYIKPFHIHSYVDEAKNIYRFQGLFYAGDLGNDILTSPPLELLKICKWYKLAGDCWTMKFDIDEVEEFLKD